MKWAKKDHLEKFLYALQHGYAFTLYDTETTGLKATDYIVQFSGIRVEKVNGKYQVTKMIDQYIKPPIIMSQEVIDVHGITNEFLADKPSEEEAFTAIKDFLSYPAVIMGYNVSYDNRMTNGMFERQGEEFQPSQVLDVFKMVKELCLRNEETKDRKLASIASLLGITGDVQFHSAIDDILVTWKVAQKLYALYVEDLQKSSSPKYKAQVVSIDRFDRGKYVQRLYVTLAVTGMKYKIYYDCYNSFWSDVDEICPVLGYIDMDDVERQMNEIAKLLNKDKFHLIKNKWTVSA